MKKILIGSDHAGFDAKKKIAEHLRSLGHEVTDCGTYSTVSCDYPIIAHRTCAKFAEGGYDFAVLICGTGIGVSIAANKHAGIRAALCNDIFSTEMARQHNDANVLCLGARVLDISLMNDIADTFIATPALEEERHVRRQAEMKALDDGNFDELFGTGAVPGK
ncbi:MAG: ribose 5-phosphate isomerase B [Clostridia bacterium]|nr:ribose 5-phosphate isomerase B [Clostridia bacterium]